MSEHLAESVSSTPELSVVITTFDRPAGAHRAVQSVLEAGLRPTPEVIVVDDGSSTQAAHELDELATDGIRILHQPNLGLGAARATGAAAATGRWISFLDDDDRWLSAWRELPPLMGDGVGIVSGGARFVDRDGRFMELDPVRDQGPILWGFQIQYLAGCFAIRRDVYDLAGGYLPGLSSSHQFELFIRCTTVCKELGLTAAGVGSPVAEIERRSKTERVLSNPKLSIDCTRWILARHALAFARDPVGQANWNAVASLNAVRLKDGTQRRHALRSIRTDLTSVRRWLRALAVMTPFAELRWGREAEYLRPSQGQQRPLVHVATLRGTAAAAACSPSDLYFLPWRYKENPPASADSDGIAFWDGGTRRNDIRYQQPVYAWAARLLDKDNTDVIDVGCGSGHKLVAEVAPRSRSWLGVDQESAIKLAREAFPQGNWEVADLERSETFDHLSGQQAGLVICADVLEHVSDPAQLLAGLRRLVRPGGRILLSTPDRSRLEGRDPLGPPGNPRHIREWTADELRLLIESAELEVVRVRHLLPRSYSATATEVRRTVHRLLHRRALPDRRSCMAFLLRTPGTEASR